VIYLTLPILTIGVADLWYEQLNLQKMKQARQNIFGISTYLFSSVIQQRLEVIFTLNEREYQTVSIWIIRHGQSQSNAGLATIGPHENALSELGDRQSRCIPTAVKQTPDLIVTSPYLEHNSLLNH
jgi:hypothetical protein